jgi:hypothetical protein
MTSVASRTFITRCSLVVRPISLWTGRPPADSALTVRLQQSARQPIRTSDGSYAFLDIPDRRCTLMVHSPHYLPVEMPLDLDQFEPPVPIVDVELRPNRLHPLPPAASGFRFRVVDQGGAGLKGADVSAKLVGKGISGGEAIVSTWSDEDGSVVLPLRGQLPANCTAEVEVAFGGKRIQASWKVEPYSVIRMPDVQLVQS